MNSVPNSNSEQCTKSKLGRVHNAHTHGPSCSHAARWAGCIMAHQASCRGRVAAHARSYRALYRASLVVGSSTVSQLYYASCCCLYRDTPSAKAVLARTPLTRGPAVSGPVSAVSWRMLSYIMAKSWLCRGFYSCAQLPYVTIQFPVS